MKIKIFVITLLIAFCNVFAVTWGVPDSLKIGTFAINNYQSGQRPLSWSLLSASTFRNYLEYYTNLTYPSVLTSQVFYEESDVMPINFFNTPAKKINFLMYQGHGERNLITLWDGSYVYNSHAGIGLRNTYWAMLISCLVFKNNETNQEPWFSNIFRGTHSILGFSSSLVFSSQILSAVIEFTNRWIVADERIWDSFYKAFLHGLYEQGGYGSEPKIVYRYGYVDGDFFDPWEERFSNAVLGPVFYSSTSYDGYGSRWITIGTPTF